jgi:hypothetical protein
VRRDVAPPSGAPAPEAHAGLDLRGLATALCAQYRNEFPDEPGIYGEHWEAWCRHDNQYILHWALLDTEGVTSVAEQVRWLAGVLASRGFPLERLRRDLEIAAAVLIAEGREDAGALLLELAPTVTWDA